MVVLVAMFSAAIAGWIWHPLYTTTEEMAEALQRGMKAVKRAFRQAYDARFKKKLNAADAPSTMRLQRASNLHRSPKPSSDADSGQTASAAHGKRLGSMGKRGIGGGGGDNMGMAIMRAIQTQVKGTHPSWHPG